MKKVALLMLLLMLVCVTQAAYLDAEPGVGGNTVRASDGDVNAWWVNATSPDGLWGYRAFGFDQDGVLNGDGIYEASGTGSGREDCPAIITTISGLNPGTVYQIEVVYWSSDNQNWCIRAGFSAGSMTLFDRLGDTDDGATAGTLMEGFHDGDRDPYTGLIGTITADSNGEVKVYLDDKPSDATEGSYYDRSWYDGLMYEVANVSNPVPPDDPAGENPVPVTQDLGWTILGPNVEYIDLYLSQENEPNLVLVPGNKKLDFAAATTSYDPGTLMYDTAYFWRVDTYEPNTLPGSTDYIVSPGPIWTFTTVPEAPVVNPVVPAFVAVDAGEPNVVLSAPSLNVETFEWYKVGDPNPLTDQVGVYSGTNTDTLTIFDVQLADEGYYYCVGSNTVGSDSSIDPVTGEGTGRLMIKRLTSYWPLDSDNAAFVDGNDVQVDIVDGYNMVLASAVVPGTDTGQDYPTLTSNVVDPVIGDESLLFNNSDENDPNNAWGQYALIESGVAEFEDITISTWVLWNGGGNWQRIIDFGNGTGEYMFLSPNAAGTNLRFVVNDGGEQNVQTAQMQTGEWVHITVTLNANTARMYVNGELVAANPNFTHNPLGVNMVTNYIGDSQFVADPYLNGLIDDLKIYNYARTTEQIALDYLAVKGDYICNNEAEALLYDYNDDCLVNLEDFAMFVTEWLDSNRIYAP